MSEETDAPQGGAGAIVEHETLDPAPEAATAIEQTSDNATEQEPGTVEAETADDAGAEPKPKQVPWFQKRIDELTAKKYEAERRAAYFEGLANAGTAKPVETQPAVPDRYDDPEGYDRYLIEQTKRELREELSGQRRLTTYGERVAKIREAKPDYDSVTTNPDLAITPAMAEVIMESDVGPEVAYHLGTNPAEAARIASLSEKLQAKELGRLEERLSQPVKAPQARTPPPPPPQTVAGLSAGVAKTPESESMAEYIARRKAEGI
jgi:hypothetical protein